VKLKSREQTNDSAGNTLTSLSQAMILCNLGIGELVETSGLFHQKALLMEPL
jgi:hypothetical protein